MKIICIMPSYQGHDFIQSAIDSVYNYVDKIIIAHSTVSWIGQSDSIGNTCLPVMTEWKKINDYKNLILNISGAWNNQHDHYNFLVNFVQRHYEYDYLLVQDSDEVWSSNDLERAIKYLEADKGQHDSFSCRMFTYLKSPYYRISPTEPCAPTIFLSNRVKEVLGVRCNRVLNKQHWDDIKYHHLCYVRENDESIRRKFLSIQVADGSPSGANWITNIYNKININTIKIMRNLHPTKGAEPCWQSIVKVNKSDLPIYLQKNPVLLKWNENTGEKIK